MLKKLRQITDNIHGTIYLSEIESELISTPFFYRLNDIYQSSTVYMTFPSNRTKRYEHSLGTMALSSKMLFSSVTNADDRTREELFSILKNKFLEIVRHVISDSECELLYFSANKNKINEIFDNAHPITNDNIFQYIRLLVNEQGFFDNALAFYQYYPMARLSETRKLKVATDTDGINIFLYRCLLQAVRIVALFHDVGHPPYSHIIEKVLIELYDQVEHADNVSWDEDRVKEFKECLTPFFTENQEEAYKCKRLYTESSLISAPPHERIGLGLLDYAIHDVLPLEILSVAEKQFSNHKKENQIKVAYILYYITVVEFAFAILTEKDIFFKSFHKIVDGPLDSDRLDYIVRDSQNSGVDWGIIPYERIINSAKLFYLEKDNNGGLLKQEDRPFVIAYPRKISDDLEDLILVRYKIFARINFHHRCMRTSVVLQETVKELALDFLMSEPKKNGKRSGATGKTDCINSDISILWTALASKTGSKNTRVIQWNDSWLISTLHKALISPNLVEPKYKKLRENLEELLLNRKRYYTLMKRGVDNRNFAQLTINEAGITPKVLKQLYADEYKKLLENKSRTVPMEEILINPKSAALDSLNRLEDIMNNLDIENLCKFIPLADDELIAELTKAFRDRQETTNAAVIINTDKGKDGLPKHADILEAIYLYNGQECVLFDVNSTLRDQINAVAKNVPWLYVYFVPSSTDNSDINMITTEILNHLAKVIGELLRHRFDELFGGKRTA